MASVSELIDQVLGAKDKARKGLFKRGTAPRTEEFSAAEARLSIELPHSYKQFLKTAGVGVLGEVLRFLPPSELYQIDVEGVEFNGFISFATDIRGNSLAFDPNNIANEREKPVYYICHDPFGFGPVAQSFPKFLETLSARGFDYEAVVDGLPSFRKLELPPQSPAQGPRPWWKLW
jgi:hypothetical protein